MSWDYIPVQGSLGYEEVSATSSAAIGLTTACITAAGEDGKALILVSDYPLATSIHGTDPTSGTVKQIPVGDSFVLLGKLEMTKFRGIGIGGTSVCAVQYYQRMP
jgi:hypothetical protein